MGVTLYLLDGRVRTIVFDEQASAPAELGDDESADRRAIDDFIETAVEGQATAFHPEGTKLKTAQGGKVGP